MVKGYKITETVVTHNVQRYGTASSRALAYLIPVDEEGHLMVRGTISEAIAKAGPDSMIQQFSNSLDWNPPIITSYASKMPQSSAWATEVELFTAAQILQMEIYTYTFG